MQDDAAFVRVEVVVSGRADDEVAEAVAVDVRGRERAPEVRARLTALEAPLADEGLAARDGVRGPRRAGDDQGQGRERERHGRPPGATVETCLEFQRFRGALRRTEESPARAVLCRSGKRNPSSARRP